MDLTVGTLLNTIYDNRGSQFLKTIRASLDYSVGKRRLLKTVKYIFPRSANKQHKSAESMIASLDIWELGYRNTPIIECLHDLNDKRFCGIDIMNDRLFAIDVSHETDTRSIDVHTIPTTVGAKASIWTKFAQKYLGMNTKNCSVVLIYGVNDITVIHGNRYPEFIVYGIKKLINDGSIPLFWYIDRNPKYGRHMYLFIANNHYLANELTQVRAKTWMMQNK